MDSFHGHSETFYNTTLVDDSGSDDVSLNLSIDGLKVLDRAGRLTKRKIPLEQITRWTRNSDRLTMFVKTPADLEEKAVSFYSTSATLTSLLDSLTSFCLQCASNVCCHGVSLQIHALICCRMYKTDWIPDISLKEKLRMPRRCVYAGWSRLWKHSNRPMSPMKYVLWRITVDGAINRLCIPVARAFQCVGRDIFAVDMWNCGCS